MDDYYIWLCDLIDTDSHLVREYNKLLSELYFHEFYWKAKLDSNRAYDGLELRKLFEKNGGNSDLAMPHLDGRCSILEMMVALSRRMEVEILHDEQFGDRSSEWFWNMVGNLGLIDQDDYHFDNRLVDDVLEKFCLRKYTSDGKGGLFRVINPSHNFLRAELWSQMNAWIIENFPILL